MTTLDQAFIKAFSQQGAVPVAIPPRPAAPAAKPSPLPLGVGRGEESLPPDKGRAANIRTAREAAPAPRSNATSGVLAALERPPIRPARSNKPASPLATASDQPPPAASTVRKRRGMDGLPPIAQPVELNAEPQIINSPQSAASSEQWVAGYGQWAGDGEQWALDSAQLAGDGEQWVQSSGQSAVDSGQCATAVEERSGFRVQRPESPSQPSEIENRQSRITDPLAAESPAPPEFKPAWQVDRFTWPRVCRRLIGRAADELDRLAEALLTANAGGQKVLAIAGCRQGEGATTLLLCARRLAERGIKAVLVDADRIRPRLAKRLGVQPQFGWDEISADDETSLNQAVVEAAANNLALVPLREPSADRQPTSGDWSSLAGCLQALRDHYELVLVDTGPLEDIASVGDALAPAAGGGIDALLLVHNQRITSDEDLAEIEQRLTAAGIAVTGLIENFV